MVVKWTDEADQMLLVIALGVHKLPLNYEAIAAAWPKDSRHGTPTPRAISERIIKLRKKFASVAGDSPRKQASQTNPTIHRRGRGTRSMCPSPTPTKVENMARATAGGRARARWEDDSDDEVDVEMKEEAEEEIEEQVKVKEESDSDIEIVSPP